MVTRGEGGENLLLLESQTESRRRRGEVKERQMPERKRRQTRKQQ